MSPEKIKTALIQLDPENDALWTSDGLPKVDAIGAAVQDAVTRAQIEEALPGFNRSVHRAQIAEAQKAEPGATQTEPEADKEKASPDATPTADAAADVPGLKDLHERIADDPEGFRTVLHKAGGQEKVCQGEKQITKALAEGWLPEPPRPDKT